MSKKKTSNEQTIEASELKDRKGIAFEDQLIRVFDDVLEVGEKIVKGYKPLKSKMFLSSLLLATFIDLILIGLAIFNLLGEQINLTETLIGTIVPAGLAVLVYVFAIWFTSLKYKNTYYLLTNKRIIIRTGVFGIDFNALDISNISASSVTVSLLDKMLRKNTGNIQFGSNIENTATYIFMYVQEPYKVHKEIKQLINKCRTENEKA